MTDQPFSLLRNLARAEQPNPDRDDGQLSFVEAMSAMNINSVFDIVRRAKPAFVRELRKYSDANGDLAYENARCYATQIVRLYRNQLVSSGRMQSLTRRTGVRSLVDIGPSFPNLFKENWDLFCKVGAIEAKDSPAAYLTSLYRFAKEQLEGSSEETNRIHLEDRRPDLKELLIDHQNTFTPVPVLQIVNQVLSKAIDAYTDTVEADKDKTIYQLVAEKKHPFLFPYNFHYQQIHLGLNGKKPRLGELTYRVSLEVPATSAGTCGYGSLHQSSTVAQVLMSGLGPEQQTIVLAPVLPELPPAEPPDAIRDIAATLDEQEDLLTVSRFFKNCYGSDYVHGTANALDSLKAFTEKTGLISEEVEALLAVHEHAPYASPNVLEAGHDTGSDTRRAVLPTVYGACYVNGPAQQVPMGLSKDSNGRTTLLNTSVDRFDRLQRMIRLQRWMDIPFTELDTLIMAAIRSEGDANSGWLLTTNVLRALGVYRYLRGRYSFGAEEYAALLHGLSLHANDGRLPLFDQVFNYPLLFDTPLILDGTTFYLTGTDNKTIRTLAQLGAGLQIPQTQEDFWPLAIDTRELLGDTSQNLSLRSSIVSSLYRQSRIAAMLGLAAKDSRALLDLLGGQQYRKTVVTGNLRTATDDADPEPDMLDVLMHMDWAVDWLNETGHDITTLRRQLGVQTTPAPTSQGLIDQLNQLADDARKAELDIGVLNLPAQDNTNTPIDWADSVLAPLIDENGLVIAPTLTLIDNLPAALAALITTQLAPIELGESVKSEVSLQLLEFIFKGYVTQHRLMEGLLQEHAGLPMDRSETVMRWAGSSADHFLGLLLGATADAGLSLPLTETGQTVLESLMKLLRHAEVNQQLGLSAQALRTFLVHPQWLHERFEKPLSLSLDSFYLLDRYRAWRDGSGRPETALLGYLQQANGLESTGTTERAQHCASTLASLIGWTSSEVFNACAYLTAHEGIAVSMHEVDWIIRMHNVSALTGLAAGHLLRVTDLTPESTPEHWKSVGEAIMAASR